MYPQTMRIKSIQQAIRHSMNISGYDNLLAHIRSLSIVSTISIDGVCGSGKSYVTKQLSESLNWTLIDTDDYVNNKEGGIPYIDCLDLKALVTELSTKSPSILCGICIKEILERIGYKPQLNIYIKVLSARDIWHEGIELEEFFTGSYSTTLYEPNLSVYSYHDKFKPHENAEIIYSWTNKNT